MFEGRERKRVREREREREVFPEFILSVCGKKTWCVKKSSSIWFLIIIIIGKFYWLLYTFFPPSIRLQHAA